MSNAGSDKLANGDLYAPSVTDVFVRSELLINTLDDVI